MKIPSAEMVAMGAAKCRSVGWISAVLWSGLLLAVPAFSQDPAADDEVPQLQGEELTRGPVHEAFAQPVVFDPEGGPVIAQAPPDAIEELPPDDKPEGDDVIWIPGYWSWDEDNDRFLWVSGLWRRQPPDLTWVPGYWNKVDDGYQYVSGFWQKDGTNEVEYLPQPPESLERGPAVPATSDEQAWVPGTWVWMDTRYVWRPGYYVTCRPGWIWVPARYVWTPLGFVFVDGYWDYSVRRRGVLYAPVVVASGFVVPRRCSYTPRVVIDVDVVTRHFFCRPTYGHYYFGDYYATSYLDRGIYPWHAFHMSSFGYDPIYAYHSWYFGRTDHDWRNRIRADYRNCRDHIEVRPPHTFADTKVLLASGNLGAPEIRNRILATSLEDLTKRPTTNWKVEKLNEARREEFKRESREMHQAQHRRHDQEIKAATVLGTATAAGIAAGIAPSAGNPPKPQKLPLELGIPQGRPSRTKVAADAPPPRPAPPKLDDVKTPPTGPINTGKVGRPVPTSGDAAARIEAERQRVRERIERMKRDADLDGKPDFGQKPPRTDTKPPRVPPRDEPKPDVTPRPDTKPPGIETKPPRIEPKPPRIDTKPPRFDPKPPKDDATPGGTPRVDPKPPRTEFNPPRVTPRDPPKPDTTPRPETKPPRVESKPPRGVPREEPKSNATPRSEPKPPRNDPTPPRPEPRPRRDVSPPRNDPPRGGRAEPKRDGKDDNRGKK